MDTRPTARRAGRSWAAPISLRRRHRRKFTPPRRRERSVLSPRGPVCPQRPMWPLGQCDPSGPHPSPAPLATFVVICGWPFAIALSKLKPVVRARRGSALGRLRIARLLSSLLRLLSLLSPVLAKTSSGSAQWARRRGKGSTLSSWWPALLRKSAMHVPWACGTDALTLWSVRLKMLRFSGRSHVSASNALSMNCGMGIACFTRST